MRAFLIELWEERKKPPIRQQIATIEASIQGSHRSKLQGTLNRLKEAKDALELNWQDEEKLRQGKQQQRAAEEQRLKALLADKRAAEEEKRRNELNWRDFIPVGGDVGPSVQPELVRKLLAKSLSKLNDIEKSIQKVNAGMMALDDAIKETKKKIEMYEGQLSALEIQGEIAVSAARGQLRELLDKDPRLAELSVVQKSSHLLRYLMKGLHLLSGSLCVVIGAKGGLRSAQLAGLLGSHLLVPRHGTN